MVEDENKEKIIIEVQNDHEIDYFQRMQLGTAKVVAEYTNQEKNIVLFQKFILLISFILVWDKVKDIFIKEQPFLRI